MRKGQAFAAMKLVQGAVIALVLLGIVYGVVSTLRSREPGSDVLTISADLLASAYAAAGTGQSFSRKAKLKGQFVTGDSIKQKAGIDDPGLNVKFHCDIPVGYTLNRGRKSDCETYKDKTYPELFLKEGSTIDVCVSCQSTTQCTIYLGARTC